VKERNPERRAEQKSYEQQQHISKTQYSFEIGSFEGWSGNNLKNPICMAAHAGLFARNFQQSLLGEEAIYYRKSIIEPVSQPISR
jgi:hypothetical protein